MLLYLLFYTVLLSLSVCSSMEWTFISGDKVSNNAGYFGTDSSQLPSSRAISAHCYMRTTKKYYIYGGFGVSPYGYTQGILTDLWDMDATSYEWTAINVVDISSTGQRSAPLVFSSTNWPPSMQLRYLHCDEAKSLLYLYDNNINSEIWVYNITSGLWMWNHVYSNVNEYYSPVNLDQFVVYYDNAFFGLYLFGGVNTGSTNDVNPYVWWLDLESYKWVRNDTDEQNPFAVQRGSGVYDSTNGIAYNFGGGKYCFDIIIAQNLTSSFNAVFSYDVLQSTWNRESQSPLLPNIVGSFGPLGTFSKSFYPSARLYAAVAIDNKRQRLIVFGGRVHRNFLWFGCSDLWQFDIKSQEWAFVGGTQVEGADSKYGAKGVAASNIYPGQRIGSSSYYDDDLDVFVVFGGEFNTPYEYTNEVWSFDFSSDSDNFVNQSSLAAVSVLFTSALGRTIVPILQRTKTHEVPDVILLAVLLCSIAFIIFAVIIYFKCIRKPKQYPRRFTGTASNARLFATSEVRRSKESVKDEYDLTTMFTTFKEDLSTVFAGSDVLSLPGFKEFSINDFYLKKILNTGSMGEIYIAETYTPELCVFSNNVVVKLQGRFNEPVLHKVAFVQEISMMEMLYHHPNIAKFLGYCVSPPSMIMKYYEKGPLSKINLKNKIEKINAIIDVSNAINEIHKHDIVHCDIKSDNVLVEFNESLKRLVCVLSDFGVCQIISSKSLKVSQFKVSEVKGFSYSYAAPEVFSKSRVRVVTKASDVYSFGILLQEILSGVKPWNAKS